MAQTVFQRYEKKYLLDREQYTSLCQNRPAFIDHPIELFLEFKKDRALGIRHPIAEYCA